MSSACSYSLPLFEYSLCVMVDVTSYASNFPVLRDDACEVTLLLDETRY